HIGDSEGAILSLQEKFGGLGFLIGSVCEFISGIVQLTFGNLIILVQGAADTIAAFLDGPGGQTVEDAQERMANRLILNNEEAMSKLTISTSRGMSQMRAMTEQELQQLNTATNTLMAQIPLIADGNYNDASNKIAQQLQGLSSNQLLTLTNMNDTTRGLFQGINESMSVEQKANQIQVNMQQMQKAGKLSVDTLNKDVKSAMDTFTKQLDSKTKEAATKVDANTKNAAIKIDNNTKNANSKSNANTKQLANNIDKNTKDASNKADANTKNLGNKIDQNTKSAGSKTNTNTQDISKNIDKNTKEAANKADANTKNMADKVDKNSKNMKDSATKNANSMKSNVTSATSSMANQAINDWNRVKNTYSKTITGRVNITKTTTNVAKSIPSAQEYSLPDFSRVNLRDYQIKGSYYNSISKASSTVTNNNVNIDFSRIEKLLEQQLKEKSEIPNITIKIENITVKEEKEAFKISKIIADEVDKILGKKKLKTRKLKGGISYVK
ncbi:MAG: hypothetical protein SPK28_01775, partial [Bacilli bacterium]|nr:hypothetical protein [Bacilli bacterium]